MKSNRKFVIRIQRQIFDKIREGYVKEMFEACTGYFFIGTYDIEKAKYWKYKKSCEKSIELLKNKLDPSKTNLSHVEYYIEEITDIRILRNIKLKKLNKN